MADRIDREHDQPERAKKYTRPVLTEYGSVAKLTMTKGNTVVEGAGHQKQSCL
jgi:hypothetical protein